MASSPAQPAVPAPTTPRTPLVILSTFLLVTFGLGWLVAIPMLQLDPAERIPENTDLYYNAFLITPAIGAVVAYLLERRQPLSTLYAFDAEKPGATNHVTDSGGAAPARLLKPQRPTDALGITPLRPMGRLFSWSVLALLLFFALTVVALPVGAAFGVYPFDSSMPIFLQDLSRRLGHDATEFLATGLMVEAGLTFFGAVIFVFIYAAQEIGWRGYLYPRLQQRFGPVIAVIATGIASGLWYAPLLAVGFYYTGVPVFQTLGLMIVFCTVIGGLLAWLRMRSGSIWPAAFAQSMITSAAVWNLWFAEMAPQIDPRAATLMGWTGWLLPGLLLIGLLIFRKQAFAPAQR